jgi:hypothetical protein
VTLPRQVAPEPKELGQVLTDLHVKPGQLRGYSRRWRRPAAASVRVKPDDRHPEIPAGKGRARGHRDHGGQARHGSVPDDVAR